MGVSQRLFQRCAEYAGGSATRLWSVERRLAVDVGRYEIDGKRRREERVEQGLYYRGLLHAGFRPFERHSRPGPGMVREPEDEFLSVQALYGAAHGVKQDLSLIHISEPTRQA